MFMNIKYVRSLEYVHFTIFIELKKKDISYNPKAPTSKKQPASRHLLRLVN